MSLLKYKMTCESEDCGKSVIILVDPEEDKAPNICPFCGSESSENPTKSEE
jgi:hypothetical protein